MTKPAVRTGAKSAAPKAAALAAAIPALQKGEEKTPSATTPVAPAGDSTVIDVPASVKDTAGPIGQGEQIGDSGLPPIGAARITVRARSPQGFRRCGRHWPHAGETVSLDELAPGDIDILLNERELDVRPAADEE